MNKYIHPLQQQLPVQHVHKPIAKTDVPFKQILKEASELKVSKHAKMRLQERNIHISDEKWKEIGEKMNEAKQKGVTDALVVMDDVSLVVSTKNDTVVTALANKEAVNKIFTNINGTILL